MSILIMTHIKRYQTTPGFYHMKTLRMERYLAGFRNITRIWRSTAPSGADGVLRWYAFYKDDAPAGACL
jgi:hypothetical protein